MAPRCGHDPSYFYTSSQGWGRCKACDRIRARKSRGNPDITEARKPPGRAPVLSKDASGKECPACELYKPLDQYFVNKRASDGRQSICTTCWRKKYRTPEHNRRVNLKAAYGITPEDYDEILSNQNGVCAICREDVRDALDRKLCIDHDHATGKVRGILCVSCNNGLGRFKDNPRILIAAYEYLASHLLEGSARG